MDKADTLDLKISEVKALMDLHENYSNVDKINQLVKQLETLQSEKETTELEWISKSEEYEAEFGSDES